MKQTKRILALSAIAFLSLTACDLEKKCYCLETSNDNEYHEGYCAQISNKDVVEEFYVFCPPSNPEDSPENYKYEITWNGNTNTELNHFELVGGLKGKRINFILNINKYTLRINVTGSCFDEEATYGYIKVSREGFKSHGKDSKDAVLLAYIAIGDQPNNVPKPEDVTWK